MTHLILAAALVSSADPTYVAEVQKWRDAQDQKLRADNGWLTLAGRFPLKAGANTFGTGQGNDILFPAELKGTGPDRLGTLVVDADARTVMLKLADGVTMTSDGKPFTGDRPMGTATDKRDWVSLGRLSFHVIERGGKYVLRLADNESAVRKTFAGRVWYPVDEAYKVEATFTPAPAGKTLAIVNILEEASKPPCAGTAEFRLNGATLALDAIAEGDGLFFVFKDRTAGDTTYGTSRFLDIEKRPAAGERLVLDFNKAYNPPCAVSEFTTCPRPPRQNVLAARVEAGEKYRGGR